MKINKIDLIESRSERISTHLSAKVVENGDLMLEGQDLGSLVEKQFGDSDYEYSSKIKSEYKDTILLYLIKEKFASESDFKRWLNEKHIPTEFWSF